MVDAGGPGSVKQCATVGLADLGDTAGWGLPGKEDTHYAFQLSGGVYNRIELPPEAGPLSLGGLSDVDVSAVVEGRHYRLLWKDGSWKPFTDVVALLGGWELDFKPVQPFLHLAKQHVVKKLQNKGQVLAAYMGKRNVVVERTEHGYVLGAKKDTKPVLKLVSEFPFKVVKGGSIIFEVVLGKSPGEPVTFMLGVKLNWPIAAEGKLLVMFIRVSDGQRDPFTRHSLPEVKTELTLERLNLNAIHLGNLKLRRLLYTELSLSSSYVSTIHQNPTP